MCQLLLVHLLCQEKIKEQNSLFENQGLFIDKKVGTGNIRQITIKNKKFK